MEDSNSKGVNSVVVEFEAVEVTTSLTAGIGDAEETLEGVVLVVFNLDGGHKIAELLPVDVSSPLRDTLLVLLVCAANLSFWFGCLLWIFLDDVRGMINFLF